MPIIGILASSVNAFQDPLMIFAGGTTFGARTSTDGLSWNFVSQLHANTGTSPLRNNFLVNGTIYSITPPSQNSIVYKTTNGQNWSYSQWPVSLFQNSYDNGISYVNNYWMISSDTNLYYSTDTVTWSVAGGNFGSTAYATGSVAYGNGTYVQPAYQGKIWTSTDLNTWTSRNILFGTSNVTSGVMYGGGLFVAVVLNNATPAQVRYTSTDAITWTSRGAGPGLSAPRDGLIYANNLYLQGDFFTSGIVYTSTNAITWTTRAVTGMTAEYVGYANNYYYALDSSTNEIAYSTDGTTWSTGTISSAAAGTSFLSIIYLNNNYYAFGEYDATDGTPVYSSTDLVTWNPVTDSNGVVGKITGSRIHSVIKANNKYYFAGATGYLVESNSTFSSWTTRNSGFTTNDINDITYGNNTFVAVGNSFNVSTSSDGVTWTMTDFGTTNCEAVAFGNGIFVLSNAAAIRTSTDGVTWTNRTSGSGSTITTIRYLNNNFLYTAGTTLGYSTNGTTWTANVVGTAAHYDVSYGAGVYVAVGNSDTVRTSTDGTTWTAQTSPFASTAVLMSVVFSNNIFIVIPENSPDRATGTTFFRYITSTDGITWTSRSMNNTASSFYSTPITPHVGRAL